MIQKSTAHLLALATLTPIVVIRNESEIEAIVTITVHDRRFAMYEIRRRNLSLGEKYFQHVGTIITPTEPHAAIDVPDNYIRADIYIDEGAQVGHSLQFTVVGLDVAGNRSAALITDVILVGFND